MPTLIAIVEWPDGLTPSGPAWDDIRRQVASVTPDILITNELPFGHWVPVGSDYDANAAAAWVDLHERGLEALSTLEARAVLSTRPVHAAGRLANEAFVIEDGAVRALHQKQFFPDEAGWHEARWFTNARPGFALHETQGLKVGVMLCTELMFNEHARAMGRAGADLIAVPRASGRSVAAWQTAVSMAALVGGAFAASSNRVGQAAGSGPIFGGHGLIASPGGAIVAHSAADSPLVTAIVDPAVTRAAKLDYPVYVAA